MPYSLDKMKSTKVVITIRFSDCVVLEFWNDSIYPTDERWCGNWDEVDSVMRAYNSGTLDQDVCTPAKWRELRAQD